MKKKKDLKKREKYCPKCKEKVKLENSVGYKFICRCGYSERQLYFRWT